MSKKKNVSEITSMEEDFAQWYTDVVIKAELASYSVVGGNIVFKPNGYAIWELIQKHFNKMIKDTNHQNVYMPLLIPESLLEKEKDHVKGFAPEVAWVTHGGDNKLTERLCIRPTSEVLFCDFYSKEIESYRDLPKLYNQWCSVLRWEKTTRPFLRTREFLWQEGHTAHATAEESLAESMLILGFYTKLCEEYLALPVIQGEKTESERFAGANNTFTIESLMHDGQALQSGTTHDFGDGFAKAFDIKYIDKDGKLKFVHQSSWGISTRLIGAIIMRHSDNEGLVLPPRIAPNEIVVIPVASHKEGVNEKAQEIYEELSKDFRCKIDLSDKSPGWKFSEHEMQGVPIRLEIGPRDIESNTCILARRDTKEKISVSLDNLSEEISKLLNEIHDNLFQKAKEHIENSTSEAKSIDEIKYNLENSPGFIKGMWCGSAKCEEKIKNETGATSRCIPFEQEEIDDKCLICGKESEKMVIWGRAY